MKFYNTLTRQKEEFKPNNSEVKIYTCGPTVYGYAHIGNLRAYVFMDILRRALKYNGFKLNHVMNITDVGHLVSDGDDGEDKMLKGARELKKTPWEIAGFYTDVFMKDIDSLNIQKTEIIAKVTDHIDEMVEFVEGLIDKGLGYEINDGIYFDISKFPGYGKLSKINLDDLEAGKRVDINDEKRHPADFALWKKAPKEHIMQWESPWGMGYPGWHIECSALSKKYLGISFDIHTGGVDHIPIHHENEIAQSEGLTGVQPAKYWMHNEFVMVDNGKMSKSLGNTYTLEDLMGKGICPLVYRYFCLNAHYRNKLNFTWEGIKATRVSYERLLMGVLEHNNAKSEVQKDFIKNALEEFESVINDDLNVPKALGIVWNLVRNEIKSHDIYELLLKMDSILGLGFENATENLEKSRQCNQGDQEISTEILQLVERREQARLDKNWKLADEIRNELNSRGFEIKDSPEGSKIIKKQN
jgi:cysteinyl-tRNA synthetase